MRGQPRSFSAEEDVLIRSAHCGEMGMRELARTLRCSLGSIYRRMGELGLSYRKADHRRQPRRDFLRLLRPRQAEARSAAMPGS